MSWNPNYKYSSSSSSSSHQQEPRKGSAYTVLSHGNNVLAAKKKDRARWWEHTAAGTPIFNNPGQYVFPGGGYTREGNENTEAAIRRSAPKEFTEETGLDLDLPTNRIFMNYGNPGLDELISSVNPVGYYHNIERGRSPEKDLSYGAVHMQVPNIESLNNIVNGFNRTSAWDNALYGASLPYNKWRKDDELASLHIMPAQELMQHFKRQNERAYNLEGNIIPTGQYRNIFTRPQGGYKEPELKTNWFQNILNNRFPPHHASASSSSSSSSSSSHKRTGGHVIPPYLMAYLRSHQRKAK